MKKSMLILLCTLVGFFVSFAARAICTANASEKRAASVQGEQSAQDHECQIPDERLRTPFKDEQPIYFVTRTQAAKEWDLLSSFWNETTEKAVDPHTGAMVERKAVKIKTPLGLTQGPPVPAENPMTVEKWRLGKQLYFDRILSSDSAVACATCHRPQHGFTDQSPFSTGIRGLKGGMSAPTVINSAYNVLQFWDGRALSLEDQAQGPVQNPVEMFGGEGHAWNSAVGRVRKQPDYVRRFHQVFGCEPTQDTIAKAIACYERTVLSADSIHDRADLAMRRRVEDEESGKYVITPKDYEKVLREALTANDREALEPLSLQGEKDAGKLAAAAKRLDHGRELFFGKARCNSCHVGDNFTDNQFHNLGVSVKDGRLPPESFGRFSRLPVGHKNPEMVGAFKTPTLRSLLRTKPYMHDGSEASLEKVVDFYDRGGEANEFLDAKMRDYEAEKSYILSANNKTPYQGPPVKVFTRGGRPVIPLRLNLTPEEKADLVYFLRALEGDSVDPVVADPSKGLK